MSWIENIRNSSPKKKQRVAAILAGSLLLLIVIAGVFWYEAPYGKNPENRSQYSATPRFQLRNIFRTANQKADNFVEPIDQHFTQQNKDKASGF